MRPPSPENCTIIEESRSTVRVSCAESDYVDAKSAMYVLQVFDAETRRLLASATSMTPSMLEVTDLPAQRSQSGLVLFLRVMTAHATSDATILHSGQLLRDGKNPEHQRFPGIYAKAAAWINSMFCMNQEKFVPLICIAPNSCIISYIFCLYMTQGI